MIFHWKGYGLFVPAIFLGCFALVEMAGLVITGDSGAGSWPLGAALLSAAVVCWSLGRWLRGRGSLLQDLRRSRQVGPEDCLRSYLWIKMEWWGPVFLVLGLLWLIAGSSLDNKTKSENPESEPGGAANGSQPTHSQTNRTSSAAGSRR